MKLNKLFTVAALAVVSVASNYASAATTFNTFDQGVNLTSYNDGHVFASSGSPVLPTTFDYTYNFNLNPASAFTGIVSGWAGVNYSGFSASLTGANSGSTHYFTESVGSGGQSVLSLGSVSGDSSYSLHITGTAGSGSGATFNVNLSSVAAVPEPETFAMLLAGLGLIGMVARRRNKVSMA